MNDSTAALHSKLAQLTRELEIAHSRDAAKTHENARLRSELEARTDELDEALQQQTATAEVLKVISRSAFDLQPVLNTLVELAGRLCQAENVQIFLRDGEVYRLAAHNGFSPEYQEYARQHPIAPGRGTLVARTALEVAPIHIADVLADSEYTWHQGRKLAGFRALLGIPLLREGSCVGVMAMTRATPRPFTDKQIDLVTTFADQAVIAIENARLFQEVQARTAEVQEALTYQTATSNVLDVISRSPDKLEPVLQAIVQTAARICDASYADMVLTDSGKMHIAATFGDFGRPLGEALPLDRTSVMGRTIVDGRSVHVTDLQSEEHDFPLSRQLALRYGHRAILGVPLMRQNRAIGAILLRRTAAEPFSEKQIAVLRTFADQAVIAINNVDLFQEVQARTRELTEALEQQTATSEVLQVINASPRNLAPVFDAMLVKAAELCNAELGILWTYDGGAFTIAAERGAPAPSTVLGNGPVRPGPTTGLARIAREKRVVHIPDLMEDEGYRAGDPIRVASVDRLGMRSWLGVPLLKEGSLLGVFTIYRVELRPFSEKEIALLSSFADQAVIAINNVGLFEEVQARTEELSESLQQQTATADVLKVISRSTFDLQTVFETLVELAARLCQADRATIHRLNDDRFTTVATFGLRPEFKEFMAANPMGLDRGSVSGRAALDGRAVHISDVLADPEYTGQGMQQRGGFRTALGVPLMREGSPIGAIFLARGVVLPFTDKQIELVTTFADQAVIAIENVRLFDEVQARTRELTEALEQQTATSEVLQVINASPGNLAPVFEAMLAKATQLCNAKLGIMWSYNGEVFTIAAERGTPPPSTVFGDMLLRPGPTTALGRVQREKRVLHIPDMMDEEAYRAGDPLRVVSVTGLGMRSWLGVPLLKEGKLLGVFTIYRGEVRPFSDKEIALVTSFAEQAVIAIENVRLFEEVQARTRELQELLEYQTATSEVLNVISRSPSELQPVLSTIVETAGRLCEADFAFAFRLGEDGRYRLAAANPSVAELVDFLETHPISPGDGSLTGRVALERRTVHVPNAAIDPDYRWSEWLEISGFHTFLSVPLMRDGAVTGVIALARTLVQPFADKQIELVTTFADQAVIAIENVRLFEEVQATTRELTEALEYQTATSDVLGVISSSPTQVQPVFDSIAASAQRLCSAKWCGVVRYDGHLLELAALSGLTGSEGVASVRGAFPRCPIPGGATDRAILNRAIAHIPDILDDSDYPFRDMAQAAGFRSHLSVPMTHDDRIIGAITVAGSSPGHFSDRQVHLLRTFAEQAVIAIQNARLFEEVQARTAELTESLEQQTATSEVLHVIGSSLTDTQPAFDAIVKSGSKLFPNAAISIALPDGDQVKAVAFAESDPARAEAWRRRFPNPLTREYMHGAAILDCKIVDIEDVAEAPPEFAIGARNFMASGYRAVTIIPMIRNEAAIGALSVIRVAAGPLSEKERATLRTFASQAVIAIENTRLLNELRARTEDLGRSVAELRALGEVSHAVNSTLDLETVLSTIVAKAVQLSSTEAGAIYVFSKLRQKFRLRATYGMSEDMIAALGKHSVGLGESYIGAASR